MDIIQPIILIVAAYLLGSFSTAVFASKLFRFPDPRFNGSQNPGATNVLRLAGKPAAVFTVIGDALKGLVPVIVAKAVGLPELWIMLIAIAAFLGHLFPLFYNFKGGKGVATAMGIFLGLNPVVGLAVMATWLSAAFAFNISSVAAMVAVLLAPFFFFLVTHSAIFGFGLLVITALIFWRHIPNIQKLLQGNERPIIKDASL